MIVEVTRQGRSPQPVTLTGPPVYVDHKDGGLATAVIPCVVPASLTDRLLDATVLISDQLGPVWIGWVWEYSPTGLMCVGPVSRMDMISRRMPYAVTAFFGELKDYNGTQWTKFSRSNNNGGIQITQNATTTTVTNDCCGFYLWGDIAWERMSLTEVKNHALISLEVLSSATAGSSTTQRYISSAGTTGTTAADFSLGGSHTGFVIRGIKTSGGTPTQSDVWVRATDLVLYGTSLDATELAEAANIVSDSLTYLPTTDLPAGDLYRRLIETGATISGGLIPLDLTGTEAMLMQRVIEATGWQFAWRVRDVNGLPAALPIFRAEPTTAKYNVHVDGTLVTAQLKGATMDGLRSRVTYSYADINGAQLSGTVTDTDQDHYLVKIGRTYDQLIVVDTTSGTRAQEAAQAALDLVARSSAGGSILVRGPQVNDAYGRPVPPGHVEAGELITITGTPLGEVTTRILSATHVGEHEVTLALDSSTNLAAVLKRAVQ